MTSKYNPEKRAWKGRSYKKGGKPIKDIREDDRFNRTFTPCHHPCLNCGMVDDCMCAGGDGRYKRCSRRCNSFGRPLALTEAQVYGDDDGLAGAEQDVEYEEI